MNSQEIEDRILSVLHGIPGQFPNGALNPEWTKAILLEIGALGKELDYEICGLREHFQPEWLFDLCWYSCAPDGKLLEMPLVLESEWDAKYEGIKYDFEKLLIAKSTFKVLVFQATGQTATDYFNKFEQGIRTFQGGSSGEVYLLACFNEDEWKFEIKIIRGSGNQR
jgi:hypothetical protein